MPIELKVPWRTDVCTNLEAARRLHLFVSFSVDLSQTIEMFSVNAFSEQAHIVY